MGYSLTMSAKPKRTSSESPASPAVMTVPRFAAAKASGTKLSVITAYDFSWAGIFDAAGVDALLVGDSVAMVVQGHATTLPVTLDEIIYHAKMVVRGTRRALGDRRYAVYVLPGESKAGVRNAGRILEGVRGIGRQTGRWAGAGGNDPRPHGRGNSGYGP